MAETVTRIVCSHCGNTRAEIRKIGAFNHAHEFVRWTGIEEPFPLSVRTEETADG